MRPAMRGLDRGANGVRVAGMGDRRRKRIELPPFGQQKRGSARGG